MVNTDIRISVEFWHHPKVGRLTRNIGIEGVRSLQVLWCWAAVNKPDGILTGMDDIDIEFSADWRGTPGEFFSSVDKVWLDLVDGVFVLHDWLEHNPWAHDAMIRSNKARMSRFTRENKVGADILKEKGVTGLSSSDYQLYARSTDVLRTYNERTTVRSTPAPTPVPTPTTLLSHPKIKKTVETYIPSYTQTADGLYVDQNGQISTTPF